MLVKRIVRGLGSAALVLILATAGPVLALRWLAPPASSFMAQQWISAWLDDGALPYIEYEWVPWKAIAPTMALAVVAAEDQRFLEHHGFDLVEIQNAVEEHKTSGRLRGASTITQQVAKNLFLWPGRSWVRKGFEAYFAVLIELSWPKRRILEVYLNIAQFGDKTFGVGAASRHFFNKSPDALTLREAALLAAVLPNPARMHVRAPSTHVRGRAAWIHRQARQLGAGHLSGL